MPGVDKLRVFFVLHLEAIDIACDYCLQDSHFPFQAFLSLSIKLATTYMAL
jgi:hypothetical protein